MLDLAETNKISLRGQTKTHKTVEGGIIQTGDTGYKEGTWQKTICIINKDK